MIDYIIKKLKKRGIELDSAQLHLIHELVESIQPDKDLNNKLDGKSTKKSFYVWGDV